MLTASSLGGSAFILASRDQSATKIFKKITLQKTQLRRILQPLIHPAMDATISPPVRPDLTASIRSTFADQRFTCSRHHYYCFEKIWN
jgi:hypothetical protein